MTRWKVGTTTGTGTGTLTTEPDGEVVLYDDVAELERRYREAVDAIHRIRPLAQSVLLLVRGRDNDAFDMAASIRDIARAFLAGEVSNER